MSSARLPKVLVGVDGSPPSDAAVRWAAEGARTRGAELLIVHAVDTSSLGLWLTTSAIRSALREMAQPVLDAALELAATHAPEVPARGRVMIGSPTRALRLLSRDVELTVLGRSGRNALSQLWFGSVTLRILTQAASPVMSVPLTAPLSGVPTRVVIGTGESESAATAFAFEQARRDSVPFVQLDQVGTDLAAACGPSDLLVLGHRHHSALALHQLGADGAAALAAARCVVAIVHERADGH